MDNKTHLIHYGCGMDAPDNWLNFDVSPTLRIQKIPVIGKLLAKNLKGFNFPDNVQYGNIVQGLPLPKESAKAVYCSHVIEHLSLKDAYKALQNTYDLLIQGGVFRLVVPDLEKYIEIYNKNKEQQRSDAAHEFMKGTYLGIIERSSTFKGRLIEAWGNSNHLWMWDENSLSEALKSVGFSKIRRCEMGDSNFSYFDNIEKPSRYIDHLSLECIK